MTQVQLIEKIHHEFDSAQDRLLSEAKAILTREVNLGETPIETMAKRLASIGFSNTPVVKEADIIKKSKEVLQKTLVSTKEQAELIEYYKATYPFLKFLTEAELDRICTKYKLVYAPISSYIKDVPEKNVGDIEIAQILKSEDIYETRYSFNGLDQSRIDNLLTRIGLVNGEITHSKVMEVFKKSNYLSKIIQAYTNDWSTNNTWLFCIWSYDLREPRDCFFNFTSASRFSKDGLFIAAPESHFDKKGLTKKGLGLFEVFKTEVKDPIVFRYVRGGVQIITKWGLEASDPALVVPVLN